MHLQPLSLDWPPHLLTHRPFEERLVGIVASAVIVAVYLKALAPRASAGAHRFIVCAPALVLLGLAHLVFDSETEVLQRTSAIFLCGWLGTHKVLAWTLNRGPLVLTPLTFSQFLVLLYLPIFPRTTDERVARQTAAQQSTEQKKQGRLQDQAGHPALLLLQAVAKVTLLGAVVWCIMYFRVPRTLLNVLYALGMVGFLGLLMDAPASLATSVLGLRIIPTFDQPWLSTSLADFWGRRWNISTSSVLRTLFYDPIVEGKLVKPPSPAPPVAAGANNHAPVPGGPRPRAAAWRRTAGMCGTFVASGLAHEAILQMLLRSRAGGSRPWTWKWTTFFAVQGPMLVLELQLKRLWLRAGLRPLNAWLSRALTIVLLLGVAEPFFFAPVDRDSDLAGRICAQVGGNFVAVGRRLVHLVLPSASPGLSSRAQELHAEAASLVAPPASGASAGEL